MARVVIALLLLAPTGCDYFASSTPAYPFLESPVELMSLKGMPADCDVDELRCLVLLRADGSLHFKGESISHEAFRTQLVIYAERSRDMDHPHQLSRVQLLVYPDRRASWGDFCRLLELSRDANVRMWQIALAGRPDGRQSVRRLRLNFEPAAFPRYPYRLVSLEETAKRTLVPAQSAETVQQVFQRVLRLGGDGRGISIACPPPEGPR